VPAALTPEAVPLALLGSAAAAALRQELDGVGIHLETATVARVTPAHPLQVVLQPSVRRLEADRGGAGCLTLGGLT